MVMTTLSALSTPELLKHVATLASRERTTTVDILISLNELADRRVEKLWAYCIREFRWTNGTAGRNFAAARLLRRFPIAEDYLRDGRLNCTTFTALKDVLTEENHVELFNRAAHLTEEKVDELVVTVRPRPIPAETLRKVP